ncbi:MAG: hypothetical protein AAF696_13715 [Bacteroidota bacterium]
MEDSTTKKGKGIGLLIDIGGTKLELALFRGKDPNTNSQDDVSSVLLAVNDQDGAEIDLVNGLLKLIDNDPPKINESFTTIILYEGAISYRKDTPPGSKEGESVIGVKGRLGWRPKLEIGGTTLQVDVEAGFHIYKANTHSVGGYLEGLISSKIPGLEFLQLGTRYVIVPKPKAGVVVSQNQSATQEGNQLYLLIKVGPLSLMASRRLIGPKGKETIQYSFALRNNKDFTLGHIIGFFASLVDPSVEADEYAFDSPWDFITDFNIGALLSNVSLLIEFRPDGQKVVGFQMLLPKGKVGIENIITVDSIALKYEGTSKSSKKELTISIDTTLLGSKESMGWDPVNGVPPALPNSDLAWFELRYLGLGQRVSIKNAQHAKDIGQIMRMLKGALSENEQKLIANRSLMFGNPRNSFMNPESPIEFNAESELLIGLDITLLKFLSLSIIFNDPIVYGLRLELAGKFAKNFAGLKFEILYQKVSDTIGKYHIDLTLPDFVRHFFVGQVSVTLPVIVVDIYTNSDFKLDFGFPWEFRFERSFALEVFPFIGSGGFYFNKLSAATATSTPRLKAGPKEEVGEFDPVIEFGLGLKIGVGKTFNKGPLKAEISITIQGIIEGVFSFYKLPQRDLIANPSLAEKEVFFMVKGGVALVGRLYGEVDLKVLEIDVEVLIEALIKFYFEVYKPIEISLEARVKVKGSVKIGFVRIKKSFKTKVKQEFTIDSPMGTNSPWQKHLQ